MSRSLYTAAAVNAPSIPAGRADIVAGGPKWTAETFALFPAARHVRIAASAAQWWLPVLDYEAKDISGPAALREALVRHQAAGLGLGMVYCWHGLLTEVKTALAGLHYLLWVADQTGTEHAWPGADVTQWCGTAAGNSPGPYDVSLVSNDHWLVDYR